MNVIIYLLVCLLVAVTSFYMLFSNKFLKIRILFWALFFSAMAGIIMLWLKFFFPETSWEGTVPDFNNGIAFLGKACFVLWVSWGFFIWIYLSNKHLEDKHNDLSLSRITKKVGRMITIIISVLILTISFGTFVARFYQESHPAKVVQESFPEFDLPEPYYPELSVIIPRGGSLCGTLGVTKKYALWFAEFNHLKHYRKGKTLVVVIQPGDEFLRVGKIWTPVTKKLIKK